MQTQAQAQATIFSHSHSYSRTFVHSIAINSFPAIHGLSANTSALLATTRWPLARPFLGLSKKKVANGFLHDYHRSKIDKGWNSDKRSAVAAYTTKPGTGTVHDSVVQLPWLTVVNHI